MGANNTSMRFRFINASDDTPILLVDTLVRIEIDEKGNTTEIFEIFNGNIPYQSTSIINSNTRDRKYSFRFVNQTTGEELFRANDLLFTLNKNYSIIFYGNKNGNKKDYKIFIVQEY